MNFKSVVKECAGMIYYHTFRKFHSDDHKFTWWDFRTRGWERQDGMRIDYLMITEQLSSLCLDSLIEYEVRDKPKPSDHVPVIAKFQL